MFNFIQNAKKTKEKNSPLKEATSVSGRESKVTGSHITTEALIFKTGLLLYKKYYNKKPPLSQSLFPIISLTIKKYENENESKKAWIPNS